MNENNSQKHIKYFELDNTELTAVLTYDDINKHKKMLYRVTLTHYSNYVTNMLLVTYTKQEDAEKYFNNFDANNAQAVKRMLYNDREIKPTN